MKKKIMIVVGVILGILLCINFIPKHPFSNLKAEDISFVERKWGELYADELSEEEIDELVEDLQQIEIGSCVFQFGDVSVETELCNGMYTIHYADGKEDVVTCTQERFQLNNREFVCNCDANTKIMEEYHSQM